MTPRRALPVQLSRHECRSCRDPRRAADGHGITHSERALCKEQNAADEVIDDILQPEADANAETGGEEGEGRQDEPDRARDPYRIRSITVLTAEQKEVIVPHSAVVSESFTNWTKTNHTLRHVPTFRVSLSDNAEHAPPRGARFP